MRFLVAVLAVAGILASGEERVDKRGSKEHA